MGRQTCPVCGNVRASLESVCRICGHDHLTVPEVPPRIEEQPGLLETLPLRRIAAVVLVCAIGGWLWLQPEPTLVWTARLSGQEEITTSPLLVDGLVVVGSSQGRVHAFDAATGRLRWTYQTDADRVTAELRSAGDTILAVCDTQLYALSSASGEELWVYGDERTIHAAALTDREVLVSTENSIRAVSIADGEPIWELPSPEGQSPQASIVIGGVIYTGFTIENDEARQGVQTPQEGGIRAVDLESGQLIWSASARPARHPPIVSFDAVCGVDAQGNAGAVFALDRKTGMPLWQALGPTTAIALADSRIFYARQYQTLRDQPMKGEFAALDIHTGRKLWATPFRGAPVTSPCILGTTVCFGQGARLVALDQESGKEVWEIALPGEARRFPVADDAQRIFVAAGTNILSAVAFK